MRLRPEPLSSLYRRRSQSLDERPETTRTNRRYASLVADVIRSSLVGMTSRSSAEIRPRLTAHLPALLGLALARGLFCDALGAGSASGAVRSSGYASEAAVAHSIAQHGISYAGIHKNITTGRCHGLMRYGTRRNGALSTYHRLSCDLTGSDRHVYEAQVLIVGSSPTGFNWRILSGKRRQ